MTKSSKPSNRVGKIRRLKNKLNAVANKQIIPERLSDKSCVARLKRAFRHARKCAIANRYQIVVEILVDAVACRLAFASSAMEWLPLTSNSVHSTTARVLSC